MKTIAFAILTLFCLAAAAPTTQPTEHVHRLTGLFDREREADLRAALEKVPGVTLVSIDVDHGEATFSYDPAHAFKGTKPDKIVERFDQLLRPASSHTFTVRPRSTTPRDKLVKLEIAVGLLDCKACCLGLHEILVKQDGVEQAVTRVEPPGVTVLIDPAKTNREKLAAALKAREVPVLP